MVVIGAGVSGLSLAYHLHRLGVKDMVLVEADSRLGGKLCTVSEKGFLVETGPNGFLDSKPYVLELSSLLGMEDRLYPSNDNARRRFLLRKDRLLELPASPLSFFASSVVSWRAKLRLFAEPFIPPGEAEDETVYSFVKRRLGSEFAEVLIDPMVAGIYAGDAKALSVKSAFPSVWELEKRHRSLIRGMLALRGKGGGPAGPSGRLVSFRGGVGDLVEALEGAVSSGVEVVKGCRALSVKKSGMWVVETEMGEFRARAVAVCTPSFVAAGLLRWHPVSRSLEAIPYVPVTVVALAFKREDISHPLGGFGFLVPSCERRYILGCLWDSEVFPNRAPVGYVLLRVMMAGARQPWISLMDERCAVELALEELSVPLGIRGTPDSVWVFNHPRGIPQYVLGHEKRVEEVESLEGEGLFFHCNAYRGVGFSDCVGGSVEKAKRIASLLGVSW